MSKKADELRLIASNALKANPTIVARIKAEGPKGQYGAVGKALAGSVANRAKVTVNEATWALVNAYNAGFVDDEEINDDF